MFFIDICCLFVLRLELGFADCYRRILGEVTPLRRVKSPEVETIEVWFYVATEVCKFNCYYCVERQFFELLL
jgi:hypothetical protein